MRLVPEMMASAATLRHPSGRFWDSDSDLECEDLGIAEDHRPVEPSSPDFKRVLLEAGGGRAAAKQVAGEASPYSAAPAAMEEFVEGPPTSCESFRGEDSGGFPSTGLLGGGWGLHCRSVARRGGRHGLSRSCSPAPGCSQPSQLRSGSQTDSRPEPDPTPADPNPYRARSGGDRVTFSKHCAAATEPCSPARPPAPPCERRYTTTYSLLHSLP
jgi:hypothetical protein